MKISHEYPNFCEAISFVASDKGESKVSDDNRKFAYQVPLANFKSGFDFYELNRAKDGGVYYTMVTIVGLRTICETNSGYYYSDKPVDELQMDIMKIGFEHFGKEEYVALKKGYTKPRSGCLLAIMIFLILNYFII